MALSLFRLGTDTAAMRLFNELGGAATDLPRELPSIAARVVEAFGPDAGGRFDLARTRAARAIASARTLGIGVLTVLDAGYPSRLRTIPDPPIALWSLGDTDAMSGPTVAVVGSRRATPTGLGVARRLSRELAESGVTIVSGMARGIDGAAHRGALDASGRTVAVLGNGPDRAYPAEHRGLMAAIQAAGCVISEFPPGSPPEPRHFPLRNRLISGLSQAVVVVEASEKSGSLITARAALEQGRDVLAVPGSVATGTYRGSHALIKDGARLVETVEDILEEIGRPPTRPVESQEGKRPSVNGLDRFLLVDEPRSVDELALRSGRPAAECLAELTLLEISGRVARATNGGFVKLDGPARYIGDRPPASGKDRTR